MDLFSHSCQLVGLRWRVTLKLQELGSCHCPEESILSWLQSNAPENATLKQPSHAGKLPVLIFYIISKSSSASRTADSIDVFTGRSYISKRTRNVKPSDQTQNLRLSCAEVAQCYMKKTVLFKCPSSPTSPQVWPKTVGCSMCCPR